MKRCSICGEEKDGAEFYKNSRAADGLQTHCKVCHSVMTTRWEKANKDKKLEIRRKAAAAYRKNCPEKVRVLNKKYRELRGEQYNASRRERALRKKLQAVRHYGGQCSCCGERDCRFLSVDHKHNDGHAHRKLKRINIHNFVIKNGYPDSFQILCFNCNFGRAFFGGEEKVCPHNFGEAIYA
jgi:hypothetical protein